MIKRLLQQVNNSRKLLAASTIFGCLGGLVLIIEAYYIANIVDDVFMQGLGLAEVKMLVAILLGVIILRGIVQVASEYTASKLAQQIKSELRLLLVGKIGNLGPQYGKSERSGELASTIYEGVEQLETYLAKYVPQIALSLFIPFAIFVVVLGHDLFSAMVYGVTLPLLILFMILIGKYTKHRTDKQYKLLGRLGGHFQEILRGMETLKMFNRTKDQYDKIARISEEHRKSTMATLRLAFLSAFVMELFATISTAIVAVFLGLGLIEGKIQFHHAFLILLLTPEFYAPIRALGTQFHSGMNGASAASRIFQILDTTERAFTEPEQGVKWSTVCKDEEGVRLEFEDVSLQYDEGLAPAVNHINLSLLPGQKLAIVGATGAGKSSILDMIQGFIKPTSGQITVNGISLSELSMEDWRKQITVVSQQAYLFHGTIKQNLIGMNGTDRSEQEIWQALAWSGASDFVSQLPEGIHTLLTDQIQLSGGQIQRLALTRAYLRSDAKLVLLDEATTGLDIFHEQMIKTHLQQYLQDKTAIIVAHQLETIEATDLVVVLKEGMIIEQGSPSQLALHNGYFNKMLQACKDKSSYGGSEDRPEKLQSIQYTQSDAAVNQHEVGALPSNDEKQLLVKTKILGQAKALSLSEVMRSYRKMLRFFMKHKLLVFTAVLLSFLTIAANIGLMGTSGYLIAKSALRPENVLMVYIPVIGVRFFGISRAVFRYLERLASHNVTFKTLHDMRLWLYQKIEPRGMTLLKNNRGGQILGAVISDIEQLQFFFLRIFSPAIVYILVVAVSVTFMTILHPSLGMALLVMLLIAGLVIPCRNYIKSKQQGAQMVRLRLKLYEQTVDMLRGLAALQQFGWFKDTEDQFNLTQKQLNQVQLKEQWHLAYYNGLMTAASQLGMWVLLVISIPLIRDGIIPSYMLPAILLMSLASFEAAVPLTHAFQSSMSVAISANHLFELAEEQKREKDNQQKYTAATSPMDTDHTFMQPTVDDINRIWHCQLHNVSFKYEDSEDFALQNLDLTLATGKKIAVVGESGAGKSTIIQALMKLRPISSGNYTINGQSCSELDEEAVREHFSVVSQKVQLFNASILDNIKLGNKQAAFEKVREAARLAEIDAFIMSLPKGYETMIGEYGAVLSGGQRQRLALARAILQGHAAILFDEPATGLDRMTEQAFLQNIRSIEHKHAILWITHRLQQVTDMDEIIVLHSGRIIERGTHQQLLRLKGSYYRMWRMERAMDWQTVVS